MEASNIKIIKNLKNFLESIKEEASRNKMVFIFWDINETIITSDVGINSKVNNSFKIMKTIGKGFRERTQKHIFDYFRYRYNSTPLSNVN